MTRMNSATSMAPKSVARVVTLTLPSSALSMPYMPLMGALSESTTIRCGVRLDLRGRSRVSARRPCRVVLPAGMIQVAIAVRTISANRIV